MTSMFDYDDTVNLAFDAKIAGKKLVTAKHELLTKTGEFLFLAHTDKELALRMQMVEADIEKVAHRKLANVSDSKAKLVRAIYDEWQIRHARCEFCSSWSNDTNFTKSAGDEGELSAIRKNELEKVINQDRRMHMNVPQSAIDQLNAPTDSPQEDQTEAAVKSRQNGERQTAKDNEHFGPQPFGTTPGDYVNAPKSTPQKTQPSSNVPSSVEQAVKSRQNGERATAEANEAYGPQPFGTTPGDYVTKPTHDNDNGKNNDDKPGATTPAAASSTKVTTPAKPGSSALNPLEKYTPGAGIVTKPDTSVKTLSNGAGGGNFNYPGAGGAKPLVPATAPAPAGTTTSEKIDAAKSVITKKPTTSTDTDHDGDKGDKTEMNPNAPDKEKGKATSTGPSRGDMTDAAQWISQHSPQSTSTGGTSTGTGGGGGALNAATLADYTSNGGGKPTPTPTPKPYSTMPQTQSTSTGGGALNAATLADYTSNQGGKPIQSQSMTASKIEILRDFLND